MFVLFWLHQLSFAETPVSTEEAERLFYNGQLLYEEQQFESAVLAWKKGYEITELAPFLKNIALAYEANKQYPEAIDYLKQYRAFAPFEEQEELKAWLKELEELETEQIKEQEQQANVDGGQQKEDSRSSDANTTDSTTDSNTPNHTSGNTNTGNAPSSTTGQAINERPNTALLSAAGGTALLATTASIYTVRTNNLYTQLEDVCDISSGLCMTSLNENDLLSQFNQAKVTSLSLWGGALIGAGLTVAIQQRSSTLTVQPWNGGFMLGGQF